MIGKYHIAITNDALGNHFNNSALEYVTKGNLDSDKLRLNIFGITDGYDLSAPHFNKTSKEECKNFLDCAQEVVTDDFVQAAKSDEEEDYAQAFYDLGRMIHNIQDFYSHSNWINLTEGEEKIWNEDIENPNVDNPQNFKTGSYSYVSQFLDKINPFYESYLKENYDDLYAGSSDISHYGLNKDNPGTIADEIYKERTGDSGFELAKSDATLHTEKKWKEIEADLKETLSESEYKKLNQKMAEFDASQEDYDKDLNNLRGNFNDDMKVEDKEFLDNLTN